MGSKRTKFIGRVIDENNRVKEIEGFGVWLTTDSEDNFCWELAIGLSKPIPVDQVWAETPDNQVYVISLKRMEETLTKRCKNE